MALEVNTNNIYTSLDTETFTQPLYEKSVPDHLIETKIFGQTSHSAVIEANPSEVHFAGFQIGKTEKLKLKLTNISADPQRVHIIPPSTPHFKISYEKQARLVPGLSIEINVEVYPKEWKYYNDCIRVHCKDDENILIPIHAYPILVKSTDFPKKIDFPVTPLAHSISKTIPLRSKVPVDFEFEIKILESNEAYVINPMSGCVVSNSQEDIVITFTPNDYATAHMKFQLLVSQFNSESFVCIVTGTSEPGLVRKQLIEQYENESKEILKDKDSVKVPSYDTITDPTLLKPLERSKYKKAMKKNVKIQTDRKAMDDMKVPLTLSCPSEVARILNQKDGKMNIKELKQAVEMYSKSQANRQMKEAYFEQQVRQFIMEERANQLRWMVHRGDDKMTNEQQESIQKARQSSEEVYKNFRSGLVTLKKNDRNCVDCSYRRIFRSSSELPDCEPTFDVYSNDNWAKRHSTLQRFIQAVRKIIIRERAQKHLESLQVLVDNWRRGHHRPITPATDEEGSFTSLDVVPLSIRADRVLQFRIPVYSVKDEMEPDAIGKVQLETNTLSSKHLLSYFDLKVPQQYRVMGYLPHAIQSSLEGYITPNTSMPLRVGAEDELIGLPTVGANSTLFNTDPRDLDLKASEKDLTGDRAAGNDVGEIDEDEEGEERQMVEIPMGVLKPVEYPAMTIFNPFPGIKIYYPPLKYSEIDEDYYFCPLPRFKQHTSMNPTGNQNAKPFLDRKSVIPGIMKWKRFSSQSLLALNSMPTISSVWVPRWTDPFDDELLPNEGPSLLTEPPDEDRIYLEDKEEKDDDIPLLTPEMVRAEFPIINEIEKDREDFSVPLENNALPNTNIPNGKYGLKSREKCSIQLENLILESANVLGSKVEKKMDAFNAQLTHPGTIIK